MSQFRASLDKHRVNSVVIDDINGEIVAIFYARPDGAHLFGAVRYKNQLNLESGHAVETVRRIRENQESQESKSQEAVDGRGEQGAGKNWQRGSGDSGGQCGGEEAR